MVAGLPSVAMLRDRLVGVLCLGLAATAVTWGSGPVRGVPGPRRGTSEASQRGSAAPVPGAVTTATGSAPTSTSTPAASTPTTGPVTSTTGSTAAPVAGAGEQAVVLARRILLTTDDLPPGFVTARPAPGEGDTRADGPFERCLGPDAAALTAAVGAKARSAEFARLGTGTVSSSSAVFDEPASAEKVMAILGSPPARTCFEGLMNARLARNPNLPEDVRGSLNPLALGEFGDQSTGFRFEVRLPADEVEEEPSSEEEEEEEEVPFLADFVFVRRGRALALLEFASLHRPFPSADAGSVATSLARRMSSP